ncbi:hypothetical protein NKI77_12270 [Mesorhizobium opportunistum]|uniref:Uncharacterized protein n=2 Tax=Mesorhizobium opportunistum TaxID=593909 RepID=F7YHD4_MESOW|nr:MULTISPECIES: hypothetical protein [Mesorhizobium]AEH89234.1 conserved hypothetical protein [Mesorhizobium opportunistum WSM2075]MCA0031739.1 hypothetical protein [Mesorhizobium sp. B263B2A]TIN97893.1 MAG: hypothetical protein E5Y06_02740 [Mesorhizobium sp.]TJV01267.1 MAG: hypothetical protein E5Y08_01755 [Mesorhizobium sp.]TJV19878.1 MAG: hypothetical protein E5Y07_01445 [Mesorhizobium sp.]
MKKFFLTLAGAAVLAGSMAVAPEPAMARHWHGHKQVCRVIVKKRVVWRHGHRRVIVQRVRRCHRW